MSLGGAKFICLNDKEEQCKVIEAKGRKFTIGYYMSCDHILDDKSSKGLHCEINCDAFGRVTIHNKSEEHPVSVNEKPIVIKRPLLSGSKITILGKNYLWDFPRGTCSEYEDLNAAAMSTPEKQIGIPEQPPNSCPDLKLHRDIQRRFTVHNIHFDDEGNTSKDSSQADETTLQQEKIDTVDGNEIELVPIMEETATEERCVTPEAQNMDSLIVGTDETPKMNLINCTQNKENASTEKKMKLLSLCHQSDIVITSFSPRETGIRIEKSFTAILKPTTPKSVYSTPKSTLSELNDEGSRDFMEFSTPATSNKNLTRRINNSSMHLIDLTTPSKIRPGSPYPISAVKSSTSKIALFTNFDNKKQFMNVLKGSENKIIETPDSVIYVDSIDSSDSAVEISVEESPAPSSSTAIKASTKVAGISKMITPKRTPQSLIKRALLTSAKKQLRTPVRTTATTPSHSLVQTTPTVSRKIGSKLSPITQKNLAHKPEILVQRPNITPSSRILIKGSTSISTPTGSSTADSFGARRSSLCSIATRRLPTSTSTPLHRSTAELRATAKTSPLRKVRKSVGGYTLSSHISKHRTSLAMPSRVSPTGPSSGAIASAKLKRKSLLYVSPTYGRAKPMNAAATPESIIKDPQSSKKHNERKVVLFSEKMKRSLENEDLNSTFTLDTDNKSELEVTEKTKNDATFTPVKAIDEESSTNLDSTPVKQQILNETNNKEMLNKEKQIDNVKDETETDIEIEYDKTNDQTKIDKFVGTTAKHATFSPTKIDEQNVEKNSIEIIAVVNEGAIENVNDQSETGSSINDVSSIEKVISPSRNYSLEQDNNENKLSKNGGIKEKSEIENGTLLPVLVTEKAFSSDLHVLSDKEIEIFENENELGKCDIEKEKKDIDVDCSNIEKKEDDIIENSLPKPTKKVPSEIGDEIIESENESNISNQNQHKNADIDSKKNSKSETSPIEMKESVNDPSCYKSVVQDMDNSHFVKDNEENDDLLEQIEEVLNKSDEIQKHLELAVEKKVVTSADTEDGINVIEDIKESTQNVKGETEIKMKTADALQMEDIKQNVSVKSKIDESVAKDAIVLTSKVTTELIFDKNSNDNEDKSKQLQEFDSLSSILASIDDKNEPRSPNLKGVKELLKTPKRQKILKTPNFIGVRNLMRTPKTSKSDESEEFLGVEALLKTPSAVIVEDNKGSFTPRRSARRASISAETCNTPLTPKRITKRRSSISVETEIAVLTKTTPRVNRKPIFGDSIVEDMGVIVEEISSTVTTEAGNTTQNTHAVFDESESNKSVLEYIPCVVKKDVAVADHDLSQAAVLIEEDTCEILEIPECQQKSFVKDIVFTNKTNTETEPDGSSESATKSISNPDPINANKTLGEIMDNSDYDYGNEVKDINDDSTINETIEATTPKTSRKEKSSYKILKTSERNKFDVNKVLHKTPKSIKFQEVLEKDKPSTSADSKYNRIGLQLETPKGCSTPHTKISSTAFLDGIEEIMDTTDLFVHKISSTTACENVLTETLNLTHSNTNFNQTEDEGLDKFFRTPRAKDIMVLTSPKSVNVKKSIDSVELIHSTEYDLNTTNVENLEDMFKTPVAASGFNDNDHEIVNLDDDPNEDDSDEKAAAEDNERELSAEEAFDELIGLPSSNQTPARKIYERKSLVKLLQNSPFTASDVISDLPKTDVQEWVDSLENIETSSDPSDFVLGISDIQVQAQEEADQEITMVENDNDISRDPLASSMIKPTGSSAKCIVHDSGNTGISESMINISTNSSMIDPLSCSTILVEDKNMSSLRRLSPVDESLNEKVHSSGEAEISGINMLDQTDECESILSEPLLVSDADSNVEDKPEVENEFKNFVELPPIRLGQRSATPSNINFQSELLRRSLDVKDEIKATNNYKSEELKTIEEKSDPHVKEIICVADQIIENMNIRHKEEIISSVKGILKKGKHENDTELIPVNTDSETKENDMTAVTLETKNLATPTTTEQIEYKKDTSPANELQTMMSESDSVQLHKITNEGEFNTYQTVPLNIDLENKEANEPTDTEEGKLPKNMSEENVSDDKKKIETENKFSEENISDENFVSNEKTTQSLLIKEKEMSSIASTSIEIEQIHADEESINTAKDNIKANKCKDDALKSDENKIEATEIINLFTDNTIKSTIEYSDQEQNAVEKLLSGRSFADIEATVSTKCSITNSKNNEEIKRLIEKQDTLSYEDIIKTNKDFKKFKNQSCDKDQISADNPSAIEEIKDNSNNEEEKKQGPQNLEMPNIETLSNVKEMNTEASLICDECNETPSDISDMKKHLLGPNKKEQKKTEDIVEKNLDPFVVNDFYKKDVKTTEIRSISDKDIERNIEIAFAENETSKTISISTTHGSGKPVIEEMKYDDSHSNIEKYSVQSNVLKEIKEIIPCISFEEIDKNEEPNNPDKQHVENTISEKEKCSKASCSPNKNTENDFRLKTENELLQSAFNDEHVPQKNNEEGMLCRRRLRKGSKDSQHSMKDEELPKLRGRKASKDSQHAIKDDNDPPQQRGRKGSNDSQPSMKDEEISKQKSTRKKIESTITIIDEENTNTVENQSSETCDLLSAPRSPDPQASATQPKSLPQDNIFIDSQDCTSNDLKPVDMKVLESPCKQSNDQQAFDLVVEPLMEAETVLQKSDQKHENNTLYDSTIQIVVQSQDNKEKTSQELTQNTKTKELTTRRGGRKKIVEEKLIVFRPKRKGQRGKTEYTENPDVRETVNFSITTKHHNEEKEVESAFESKDTTEEVSQKLNEIGKEHDANVIIPEENVSEDTNTANDEKQKSPKDVKLAPPRRRGRQKKQEVGKQLNKIKELKEYAKTEKDENVEKSVKTVMVEEQGTKIDSIDTSNLKTKLDSTPEVATESIDKKESTEIKQVKTTKTVKRGRKRKESFGEEERESKSRGHEVEVKNDKTFETNRASSRYRNVSEIEYTAETKTEDHDTATDDQPSVEKVISRGRKPKVLRTAYETETQTKDQDVMAEKTIELATSTKSLGKKQMGSNDEIFVEEHVVKTKAKTQQIKITKKRGRKRKEDESLTKTQDNEEEASTKDVIKTSGKRKDVEKTEEFIDDNETEVKTTVEIPKTSKSRERKGKTQQSGLESVGIEGQEAEGKTSRTRFRERKNSHADHEATIEKDIEDITKKTDRKNTAIEEKSELPQQNFASRSTREASTLDKIDQEPTPTIKQIRGRGGRKAAAVTNEKIITPKESKQEYIPRQAVASLRRTRKASTIDQHEKEVIATPKATRGRGTRKVIPTSLSLNEDDNQKPDSQVNSPLPENINDAKKNTSDEGEILTTTRGRMRKPTARAQQFLDEERAKASTPKKRLLLQNTESNSPTPQKLPARRGRKPSTVESEIVSTPQHVSKCEVTITESTSEQSHSELERSCEPANILKEKESTKVRNRGRKPGAKSQHVGKDEEEPVEKILAEDMTATESTKRTTGRRGRFVETKKLDENDEVKEDIKATRSRGHGKPEKVVEKFSKREHRFESATTVDDESDNDEKKDDVQNYEESPTTSTAALAKKRNAGGKDDSPTIKRSKRKVLIQDDIIEVFSTPLKAPGGGRVRKVAALKAQITPVGQVEVKEQQEDAPKRITRATRKK